MKLKDKSFEDKVFGATKEMEFTIDSDNHLIFEILRDKMYKDKIGSIAREVSSNSRDANRESGTDKPMVISVIEPNHLVHVGHQSISFRDYGVGISPDRMADIYIKYAASTKRDTDSQTGGFGLGAKTPFAYNDTFTVITVAEHEGKRMKYSYTAMIDSSRKGKMVLFDEVETNEDTGTEVIVPIKTPEDRLKFEKKIIYYTKYWDGVEYVNFRTSVDKPEILLQGEGYMVTDEGENSLLIDGIPYPIDENSSFPNISLDRQHSIVLQFETGDLTISANRESVQYDDDTVEAITSRMQYVVDDFTAKLDLLLESFDTYLGACRFKYKMKNTIFPEYENAMDNVLMSAISDRSYNPHMLTNHFKESSFTWRGKEVVTSIDFKHHRVEEVRTADDGYYRKRKVYKHLEKIPLSSSENSNLYYNTVSKNSRRNLTIFEEDNTDRFIMVLPKNTSTEREVSDELLEMEEKFGIDYIMYEDVKPMPREKKDRVKSSRIPAYFHDRWNAKTGLYQDSETKELFFDESLEDRVDPDKFVIVGVDYVTDKLSWGDPRRKKADFLEKENISVLKVNSSYMSSKIDKSQLKTLETMYDAIYKKNYKKWLKEAQNYAIYKAVDDISSSIFRYLDVIPEDLIPSTILKAGIDELSKARDYSSSYLRLSGDVKISISGLKDKFRKNLSKYPLLETYMRNSPLDQEETKKNITEYINQVNLYYDTAN